jgi:hypothetical protein
VPSCCSGTAFIGQGGLAIPKLSKEEIQAMRKKKLTDWEWGQVITDPSRLQCRESTGCDILTDPELLKAGCLGCVCPWKALLWEAEPQVHIQTSNFNAN